MTQMAHRTKNWKIEKKTDIIQVSSDLCIKDFDEKNEDGQIVWPLFQRIFVPSRLRQIKSSGTSEFPYIFEPADNWPIGDSERYMTVKNKWSWLFSNRFPDRRFKLGGQKYFCVVWIAPFCRKQTGWLIPDSFDWNSGVNAKGKALDVGFPILSGRLGILNDADTATVDYYSCPVEMNRTESRQVIILTIPPFNSNIIAQVDYWMWTPCIARKCLYS